MIHPDLKGPLEPSFFLCRTDGCVFSQVKALENGFDLRFGWISQMFFPCRFSFVVLFYHSFKTLRGGSTKATSKPFSRKARGSLATYAKRGHSSVPGGSGTWDITCCLCFLGGGTHVCQVLLKSEVELARAGEKPFPKQTRLWRPFGISFEDVLHCGVH